MNKTCTSPYSPLITHPSSLAHHHSPLITHSPSSLNPHPPPLVTNPSSLTAHPLSIYPSSLTPHCHCSPLITHPSSFITQHSSLIPDHSPLITRPSSLTHPHRFPSSLTPHHMLQKSPVFAYFVKYSICVNYCNILHIQPKICIFVRFFTS